MFFKLNANNNVNATDNYVNEEKKNLKCELNVMFA